MCALVALNESAFNRTKFSYRIGSCSSSFDDSVIYATV